MKLPCKDCIVFAVCKHKNPVECSILYDYLGCKINENAKVINPHGLVEANEYYNKRFSHSYLAYGKQLIYWEPIKML